MLASSSSSSSPSSSSLARAVLCLSSSSAAKLDHDNNDERISKSMSPSTSGRPSSALSSSHPFNDTCSICLSSLSSSSSRNSNNNNPTVTLIPCRHVFHKACFRRWQDVKRIQELSCCVCRAGVKDWISMSLFNHTREEKDGNGNDDNDDDDSDTEYSDRDGEYVDDDDDDDDEYYLPNSLCRRLRSMDPMIVETILDVLKDSLHVQTETILHFSDTLMEHNVPTILCRAMQRFSTHSNIVQKGLDILVQLLSQDERVDEAADVMVRQGCVMVLGNIVCEYYSNAAMLGTALAILTVICQHATSKSELEGLLVLPSLQHPQPQASHYSMTTIAFSLLQHAETDEQRDIAQQALLLVALISRLNTTATSLLMLYFHQHDNGGCMQAIAVFCSRKDLTFDENHHDIDMIMLFLNRLMTQHPSFYTILNDAMLNVEEDNTTDSRFHSSLWGCLRDQQGFWDGGQEDDYEQGTI